MSVISRNFESPGLGRGGMILAVVVLGVLISLFFIPEIIEFQRSFSSGGQKAAASKVAASDVEEDDASRLDSIDADTTPGMLDQLSSILDEPLDTAGDIGPDARASLASPTKGSKRKALTPREKSTEITWDRLKSSESRDALLKARKSAIDIALKIKDNNSTSRYALFNFANGVDFVLDQASQTLSAREATRYLNALEQSVGRAMNQEQIDRSLALRWSKVTLGPVVSPKGGRFEMRPFNPQLTVTWVKLTQRPKNGSPDPRGILRAQIGGYMIGDDIASLEFISPTGSVERRIRITNSSKDGGYRFFRLDVLGNTPCILRVRDKYGMIYQKTYDFYGGSKAFPFNHRRYELPFRMSFASPARFEPEDVDPRLDNYFVAGVWRGTEEQLRIGRTGGDGLAYSAQGQLFANF